MLNIIFREPTDSVDYEDYVESTTSYKQYLHVWFLRSHTPELEYTQRMLKSMGLKVT